MLMCPKPHDPARHDAAPGRATAVAATPAPASRPDGGGPVFLPPRPPSALARTLVDAPIASDRVLA